MGDGLPTFLSSLLKPRAYPHPVAAVQLVETHISWVLLTGEFAYKIKRPVHYAFVDLRAAPHRAFLCEEELRLNRRFAPELYLGVREITAAMGEASVGGDGEVIEHAVCMRQFRREDELDRLLAAGCIVPQELAQFGQSLADIHARLPTIEDSQPYGRPQAVRSLVQENLEQCTQAAIPLGFGDATRALHAPFLACLAAAEPWLATRREHGQVRECHGDLHCRNVVRYHGRLIAFDCLEFEPAFRWIDVAEDVAFLLMDLDARGFAQHAQAFLGGYVTRCGDFQACRVLRLFATHRALVRAKVTALEASNASAAGNRETAMAEHRAYLDCAGRLLAPRQPVLLLTSGVSGSGKTWLAQRLAPLLQAVHVRSDVERKRMVGLEAHTHSQSAVEQGLYSPLMSARVYERLADCARDALAGGYAVIVDAAFQRREDRARFRALAAQCNVLVRLIHCNAPTDVLKARIADRERSAADASEADLSVLQWQQANFEPIRSAEGLAAIDVDTTHAGIVAHVFGQISGSDPLRQQ
jgi:uncharacterized protein